MYQAFSAAGIRLGGRRSWYESGMTGYTPATFLSFLDTVYTQASEQSTWLKIKAFESNFKERDFFLFNKNPCILHIARYQVDRKNLEG